MIPHQPQSPNLVQTSAKFSEEDFAYMMSDDAMLQSQIEEIRWHAYCNATTMHEFLSGASNLALLDILKLTECPGSN